MSRITPLLVDRTIYVTMFVGLFLMWLGHF